MIKFGLLILALVLTVCSSAMAQVADDQFLIVPGERVGKVKLGMALDEVKSILGEPRSSKKLPAYTVYEWPSKDGTHDGRLEVLVDPDYGVLKIGIHLDTRYMTSEGVRAGSTMVEIMRSFAERPSTVADASNISLVYKDGITFVLPKPLNAAQVEEIIVTYRLGKAPPPAASCSLKDRTKEGCLWLSWTNLLDRQGATLVVDGQSVCRAPEVRGLPSVEGTMCSAPVPAGPHHYGVRKDDGKWCHQDDDVNVAAGRDTIVSCLYPFAPK